MSTLSATSQTAHQVMADRDDELNAVKGILVGLALGMLLLGTIGSIVLFVWRF